MKQFLIVILIGVIGLLAYRYFIQEKTDFNDLLKMENPLERGEVIGEEGDTTKLLEGTQWVVTSIGSEVVADAGITAKFEEGTLGGNDGCNSYSTTYTLSGGSLMINDQIASTLMACDEATMTLGNLYLQAVGDVRSYLTRGDVLELHNETGETIITLQAQSEELVGTIWEVTGVNNGKMALVSVLDQTSLTLGFDADNRFSASACNMHNGTYTQDEDSALTISQLISTRMACPEPTGAMDQENLFLEALGRVESYERTGSALTLRDAEGGMQVTASLVNPL